MNESPDMSVLQAYSQLVKIYGRVINILHLATQETKLELVVVDLQ